MPKYKIITDEHVTGTYEVEAENEAAAAALLDGGPPFDWDRITQTDYMAYASEVRSVLPIEVS